MEVKPLLSIAAATGAERPKTPSRVAALRRGAFGEHGFLTAQQWSGVGQTRVKVPAFPRSEHKYQKAPHLSTIWRDKFVIFETLFFFSPSIVNTKRPLSSLLFIHSSVHLSIHRTEQQQHSCSSLHLFIFVLSSLSVLLSYPLSIIFFFN